jgi:hypothetical protein
MSPTHNFHGSFDQLTTTSPKTKTGQVRAMLPQIEQAVSEGKTIKEIWQQLSKDGFQASYRAFAVYLHRARRTRVLQPATEKRASIAEPSISLDESNTKSDDPLLNVRNALNNPPGFHYRGTESIEELVRGRKR